MDYEVIPYNKRFDSRMLVHWRLSKVFISALNYTYPFSDRTIPELSTHPDIFEVAVVARAHSKWGERAMVFVVLHPHIKLKWQGRDKEFEQNIKDHAKPKLPGFAQPEWVEIVEDLPKVCHYLLVVVNRNKMLSFYRHLQVKYRRTSFEQG